MNEIPEPLPKIPEAAAPIAELAEIAELADAADTPVEPLTAPVVEDVIAADAVPAVAHAVADATADATAEATAEAAVPGLSPAAVVAKLKSLFPGLFGGAFKPIQLRVQVDIQARAPGQFSKAQLSGFLRRYTGSTGYLIALSKATHRFDLDGAQAGELSDEHRAASREELTRRKGLQQERVTAENERLALAQTQARNRAGLLFDYERTTLTLPNFCALKGVAAEELPGLLEIARQEAADRQNNVQPAPIFERQERAPRRDNPPNRRPPQARR